MHPGSLRWSWAILRLFMDAAAMAHRQAAVMTALILRKWTDPRMSSLAWIDFDEAEPSAHSGSWRSSRSAKAAMNWAWAPSVIRSRITSFQERARSRLACGTCSSFLGCSARWKAGMFRKASYEPRRRQSRSGSRCYAAGASARLESPASGTGALACRRMFAIRSSISLSN